MPYGHSSGSDYSLHDETCFPPAPFAASNLESSGAFLAADAHFRSLFEEEAPDADSDYSVELLVKGGSADVRERRHWDDYQCAYSDVLSHTSTEHAPWYVIPADRKWFMRVAAAAVILDQLVRIDPQFPDIDEAARAEMLKAKEELLAEPD